MSSRPPWLESTLNSPLKERPATVINKVPLSSLICDECDIFACCPTGCPVLPLNHETILGIGEGLQRQKEPLASAAACSKAQCLAASHPN